MQTQTLRIVIAILLTLLAALYFHTSRQKDIYSKTAEPAVAQILAEISSWEKQALFRHLAPEAKQVVSNEQLAELFDLYQSFGRFRSIQELEFSRAVSAFSLVGEKRINYSGTANFDVGLVNVNITLIERGGYFLIYNFTLTKTSEE
tara:strand:+ start:5043 stop:5483 length:441 start_codon:yes stop_codon:yes gene_type:complete